MCREEVGEEEKKRDMTLYDKAMESVGLFPQGSSPIDSDFMSKRAIKESVGRKPRWEPCTYSLFGRAPKPDRAPTAASQMMSKNSFQ